MDISIFILLGLAGLLFVSAKYAVTFHLRIPKPRGQDLDITHQVEGVDAENPTEAMKKAYKTLSKEQKSQVTKVFMKRDDSEGK